MNPDEKAIAKYRKFAMSPIDQKYTLFYGENIYFIVLYILLYHISILFNPMLSHLCQTMQNIKDRCQSSASST